MAGRFIDLTGQKFGLLQVLGVGGSYVAPCGTKDTKWKCRCDCGNTVLILGKNLRGGKSTNCGCIRKITLPASVRSHGESRGCRLYRIYNDMKARCQYPSMNGYHRYGGRGIKVCREWQNSYTAFRDWALAHGYQDGLTIDRIDNNGDYEPGNCQWITLSENVRKGFVDRGLADG